LLLIVDATDVEGTLIDEALRGVMPADAPVLLPPPHPPTAPPSCLTLTPTRTPTLTPTLTPSISLQILTAEPRSCSR